MHIYVHICVCICVSVPSSYYKKMSYCKWLLNLFKSIYLECPILPLNSTLCSSYSCAALGHASLPYCNSTCLHLTADLAVGQHSHISWLHSCFPFASMVSLPLTFSFFVQLALVSEQALKKTFLSQYILCCFN